MTARMLGSAPVLPVADMMASLTYWRDRLGFRAGVHGDPADFAILARDDVRFMIAQVPDGAVPVPNWRLKSGLWNAYVWVDDARALFEEFRAAGAHIDYELHEKPYGVLEFGIQDLDDHDIAFGQDLSRAPETA